jgi:hypoxanthine phosphoribosyltransferase
MMQDIYASVDYALIDENRLQARIREMADQITADYNGEEDLLLICVLKGGYMFLADLSRALKRPLTIDFMGVSSYG